MSKNRNRKAKITSSLKPIEENARPGHAFLLTYRADYEDGGWHEDDVEINLHEDGSMFFSERDGEGFIFLYAEQVKHLESVLRKRRAMLKSSTGEPKAKGKATK